MNALLVVLMAASTTAADPVPPAQGAVTSVPAYTYSEPASAGTTDGSRPRLFGRIRKLFRRGSQSSDSMPVTTYPASSGGAVGSNVWGTTIPAASASAPVTSSGPAASPVLRPVPAAPESETGTVRRMPAGSPF